MTTLDGLPPLREVIRAAGLSAKKSLGQNFLLDLNLTRRIARAAGPLAGVSVVEVGPGPGGLTRALLMEGADKVVAIERDERCLGPLEDIAAAYPGRLEIVGADAREVDYQALPIRGPARLVANLPYSVGTPLLIRWLKNDPWPPWFDSLVLMFQREVADRIVAAPGGKDYGRLAVVSQWRTDSRIVFSLPPDAFTPKPKVASAVVKLVPRAHPEPPCDIGMLEQVTAASFGQRRKMLRASLKQITPDPEKLLTELGLDPRARAETLQIADFCRIANELAKG
ncbi:MAG: 16S rRNA (adenine(1518)-N(6)/adenine(1519)-N(6))-dimethyltransferase RsmA [Methyloceanibacter sp.]|jgi:16S rRNA (adenine1518-N6/adenine1519-N6)-dimethyltransferase|uniref:16S rRNA (adenine(1518)-N(6)/adenine(1519)-N(6))- dimethyltransferase RsmA n=1 Tax=Methyloceanibacter sp. TaxID=1965321 RepID=UPI003C4FB111